MRYIDETEIAGVLRMADLIPVMRRAMIDFSAGRIAQPARRILEVNPHRGYFAAMPAAGADAVGAKLVTFYPHNDEKGLHTHMAVIVLFRAETGEPMAIMDGRLITEMRTSAVSAVAIDALAPPDAKVLAILGAGVQGRSHIEALSHVRAFAETRIWNRTFARAESLAEEAGATALPIEEAVRGADVVIVATSSLEPVLKGAWLKQGATVASVGWAGRDGGELDGDVMSNLVIVDSRDGTLADSGNIRAHNAEIHAELGEVLAGDKPVDPAATTVFESIGIAAQDTAAAMMVARKLGVS